jgi:glutamyl-tRNA synthetase
MTNVRTRFAPSPTGFLHVGSARTALFAWLFARKHQGAFILRIEDTDKAREVEGAIGHIIESLRWLGISWDEGIDVDGPYGPYLQSARLPLYHEYARILMLKGHAYPDPYTEEEVERFREEAKAAGKPFLYRDYRPATLREWDGSTPLRFKVPTLKRFVWNDLIMGELSAGEEALDDFILLKGDGFPTYNFAHVVDDITMHISHVMRGQEFIASTPKFLSLYEALGETPPLFATLPPILGESGTKKLSKRDGAQDVLDYRTQGYLPQALMNFLALLGWHPSDDQEMLGVEDLLAAFTLERVQRAGARFDEQKLDHLNRAWLRTLPDAEFASLVGARDAVSLRALPMLKERAHTINEAREILEGELGFLTSAPVLAKEVLTKKGSAEVTSTHLQELLTRIETLPEGVGTPGVTLVLSPYADSVPQEEGGRGVVLWPLRYALSGAERSPDPYTLIHILGPQEACVRVRTALGILS